MKLILISLFIVFITPYITESFQLDSCLYMQIPNEAEFFNPDSIKVDTCSQSSTFEKWYARKGHTFGMNVYIFGNELLKVDSAVTWEDISSTFTQIRNGFQNLEQQFGHYIIYRSRRVPSDSSFLIAPEYDLEFDNYCAVDSIITFINQIDTNTTLAFGLRNPPGINGIIEKDINNIITSNFDFKIKNNMLYISIPDNSIKYPLKLKIYNIMGLLIFQNTFNNNSELLVDLSNMPHGIYFLGINNFYKLIMI